MNGVGASQSIAAPPAELPVNRWIIGEVVETLAKLNKAFEELRFDGMADAIYHFAWGTFCDWYVELIKGTFDEETKSVAAWAFDQILVMLHPFMPFVTEELWQAMGERPYELIVAKWPKPETHADRQASERMNWLIELIGQVRAARTELSVPWSAKPRLHRLNDEADVMAALRDSAPLLDRMAKVEVGEPLNAAPPGSAQIVVGGAAYALPLAEHIDLEAEKTRLTRAATAAEKERDGLAARLSNPNFTERAKPEAVEKARADHEAKAREAERLRSALERLG
jgi:valyl-tRNA synthetase